MTVSLGSTFFRIQWYCTLTCFARWWNSRFVVIRITPLLSALWLTGWLDSLYPRVVKNCAIHKACFSASVVAIYSVSGEERAIAACCFDGWDTGPPNRRKPYLPVDFCLSLIPARSESVYPTSSSVGFDRNVIPSSKVPAGYRKIWITKLQCMEPWFAQYLLRTTIK